MAPKVLHDYSSSLLCLVLHYFPVSSNTGLFCYPPNMPKSFHFRASTLDDPSASNALSPDIHMAEDSSSWLKTYVYFFHITPQASTKALSGRPHRAKLPPSQQTRCTVSIQQSQGPSPHFQPCIYTYLNSYLRYLHSEASLSWPMAEASLRNLPARPLKRREGEP